MKLAAEFYSVRANHARKPVGYLVSVVHLFQLIRVSPHREAVEDHAFNTFELRSEGYNAPRSAVRYKSLRGKTYTDAALRLAEYIVVAHEAQAQLIDGIRTERLGVAQIDKLRLAEVLGIESWDTGSSLRDRIGVVERGVIQEIIA